MKRAVIYFSLTGNTKAAAEQIASACGADIFGVEMVKPLPKNNMLRIMIGGMRAAMEKKAPIKGMPANIDAYDEIIIGTPIWAKHCATPINTVLDDPKLCEKVTSVFTFSGGGDNDECEIQLSKKLPNLKRIAAFADRTNSAASENAARAADLIDSIMNA